MNEKLRIYYAGGPGDIVGTFRHWLGGERDPSELAVAYSSQCFDFAKQQGAELLAVSSCPRQDEARAGGMTVRNRPAFPSSNRGLGYHLRQMISGLRLLADLFRFRPDVAVIAEGTAPWSTLFAVRRLGIRVIPSLHCVVRTKRDGESMVSGIRRRSDAAFFRQIAAGCLCVSESVASQVRELTGDAEYPCWVFSPSYHRDGFSKIAQPGADRSPLRLLYAGRVEEDKGIFDLLEAVRLLKLGGGRSIRLNICGSGSAIEAVEAFVADHELELSVRLLGHCHQDELRSELALSHAIVVPTNSQMGEGFNKSVAEGVLAGRPVIATDICPAAHVFGDAVSIVQPDRPAAIAAAITTLTDDPAHYETRRRACKVAAEAFFQSAMTWGQSLHAATNNQLTDMKTNNTTNRPTPALRDTAPNAGKIAYLVPRFPEQTHAFFWREITALRSAGVGVKLFSTREPEAVCNHSFAQGAVSETDYLFPPSPASLVALLLKPRAVLACVRYLLSLKETPLHRRLAYMAMIPSAAELHSACGDAGITHLHIHSCADAAHLGAMAHRFGNLRYSLTLHGDLPVYGTDHRQKFERAAWVAGVTRPLQAQIMDKTGFPTSRAPVIAMGVDTARFTPASRPANEIPRIVTIARLIPQKGHEFALRALGELKRSGVSARYTIVGDGPVRSKLEHTVQQLQLEDTVEFVGNAAEDQVLEILRSSDIFLLPSYGLGEAAPVSLMEAMSCGLSVICSEIGGTRDMIDDGVDGILIPQKSEAALRFALTELLTSRETRDALGAAARESAVTKFDYHQNAGLLLRQIQPAPPSPGREREDEEILLPEAACLPKPH